MGAGESKYSMQLSASEVCEGDKVKVAWSIARPSLCCSSTVIRVVPQGTGSFAVSLTYVNYHSSHALRNT